MVLLQGLNYDYSKEQTSELTYSIGRSGTALKVANTEGFSATDYLVLNPKTEKAEIVSITSVDNDVTLTISATKFAHQVGTRVFKLPYNQMRFYYCASADGTYTAIGSSETEMKFSEIYTNYVYGAGTSSLYYKRTFYNSTTTDESAIADADYWQTSDEQYYITPDEMRVLMQFGERDYPSNQDMRTFLGLSHRQLGLDLETTNPDILYIAAFLLTKHFVLRGLASRSISKGYITVNVEGRNVTKAYQEIVLEAENAMKEYQNFIRKTFTDEVGSTNFMSDTTLIDSATRQEYIDNWTGTQNAMDMESTKYYGRTSRS